MNDYDILEHYLKDSPYDTYYNLWVNGLDYLPQSTRLILIEHYRQVETQIMYAMIALFKEPYRNPPVPCCPECKISMDLNTSGIWMCLRCCRTQRPAWEIEEEKKEFQCAYCKTKLTRKEIHFITELSPIGRIQRIYCKDCNRKIKGLKEYD